MRYYGTIQPNVYKVNGMYTIHRNNMDAALHICAALAPAYVGHGNHKVYETYRTWLKHNPDEAIISIDKDFLNDPHWETGEPMYLQSICTRKLCRDFVIDVLKEFAAYSNWLKLYNAYIEEKHKNKPP